MKHGHVRTRPAVWSAWAAIYGLGFVSGLSGFEGQDDPQALPTKQNAKQAPVPLSTLFYHDFRKSGRTQRQPPPNLKFLHVLDPSHLQFGPEGLLIKVPKTYAIPKGKGVGLETLFGLKGDFEITATFEGFQAEAPASGPGVGFGMYMRTAQDDHMLFSRVVQADNKHVLKMSWFNKGVERLSPCADTSGGMRLARTGPALSLLWSPGRQTEDFSPVFQCEFGDSDIRFVQLSVATGGMPCDQQVRLLDWKIRADPGRNSDTKLVTGETISDVLNYPGKGNLALALLVGLILTVSAAFTAWFMVRRRRRNVESSSEPP